METFSLFLDLSGFPIISINNIMSVDDVDVDDRVI